MLRTGKKFHLGCIPHPGAAANKGLSLGWDSRASKCDVILVVTGSLGGGLIKVLSSKLWKNTLCRKRFRKKQQVDKFEVASPF